MMCHVSNTVIQVCFPFLDAVQWNLYRVCPSESFHTGSMATGLMAHSRMAKANVNSRALLHICTALLQFALREDRQSE